jgi:hypothetical protein
MMNTKIGFAGVHPRSSEVISGLRLLAHPLQFACFKAFKLQISF